MGIALPDLSPILFFATQPGIGPAIFAALFLDSTLLVLLLLEKEGGINTEVGQRADFPENTAFLCLTAVRRCRIVSWTEELLPRLMN
jgi:hypothetical protein